MKGYNNIYKRRYKIAIRGEEPLTIQTIQQVYEDNIKFFGTLTCYLCYIPIKFGEDSIDHKIPISRRKEFPEVKINSRENLDIAHLLCNQIKQNKTEEEYRNLIEDRII